VALVRWLHGVNVHVLTAKRSLTYLLTADEHIVVSVVCDTLLLLSMQPLYLAAVFPALVQRRVLCADLILHCKLDSWLACTS